MEGATSQQMEVTSRSWNMQGNRFSPGDGRARSIVKAQITILGMFNRKTCTLKHICLSETSTFLCDKILTLDLPFFHKHYKTGGKKPMRLPLSCTGEGKKQNKRGSIYLYSLRKKVRNKSPICLGSLTGDTLPTVVQGRENSS